MHTSEAEYSLTDGYVHAWLVAGPRVAPAEAGQPPTRPNFRDEVREALRFETGGEGLTWRYVRAAADHLVEVRAGPRLTAPLEAWAYCLVASTSAEAVEAVLTAYAPPAVWVNDVFVAPDAEPDAAAPWVPGRWHYHLPLRAARNTLTVRFGRAAGANSPTAFALALRPSAASQSRAPLRVLIPLSLEPALLRDRAVFEAALDDAYLERNVYERGERVSLKFAKAAGNWVRLTARLQTPDGLIFAEAFDVQTAAGRPIQKPLVIADGAYEVLALPDTRQYHDEKRLRVSRALPLYLSNQPYAAEATGTPEGRRLEALKYAVTQRGTVFVESAKAVIGAWSKLDARPITAALANAQQQPAAHAAELVGLLALRAQFGGHASFPAELRATLDAGLPAINYAADGPVTEGDEIQLLAAEVLAGQLYAEERFAASGLAGSDHRTRAERAAAAWLRQRGREGFTGGHDSSLIEAVVVALAPLAALAEDTDLAELAAVLLDKVFFELAVGSFRGTYGIARNAPETAGALTGRLDAGAALGWLLWGQGALNHHLAGVVSLAAHNDYQLPELIAAIARHQPAEALLRAAHGAAQTVTYKTPEFMLSSVAAARPAEPGDQERAWQATLGPDAVIFTSQPANLSFSDLHRPNFWRGDLTQPRVAQWQNAVIALYAEPPAGEGLGYTHAHFPVYAFDEHTLTEGWAFARVGTAYVALTAKNGLTLQTTGDAAYRELRSLGGANGWLCQLGHDVTDGTFAEFQDRVLSGPLRWDVQGVDWTTVRGQALRYGWTGPLLVNDAAPEAAGDWLHDNPYTRTARGAAQMDLVLGEQGLRLSFDEAADAA